ncbi:tyrosine-type recombinase/integrase [Sinorhizobium meliloti]|nr:tyrosine-type recombinase/integrase [Sinorhizobium meliloti]
MLMLDRACYEAALAARFVPTSIIATRSSTPTGNRRPRGEWSRGDDRNLKHNCWLIASADPNKKRKDVEHIVSFDAAIDFPGRRLSDEDMNGDRLTKKILVLSCLTTGPRGNGALDATFVAQMSRRFDWLVRYRRAEGYNSFSALPRHYASDLSMLLRAGGVLSLVPIEERLDALVAQRASEEEVLVVSRELASKLGVTAASITRSSAFLMALIDADPNASVSQADLEAAKAGSEDVDGEEDEPNDLRNSRILSDSKVRRSLHGYLEILDFLFRLSGRELVHDPLSNDPFEQMSMEAILARDRSEGGRTATLLPSDMMRALTAAARYVTSYSEYILSTYRDTRSFEKVCVHSTETLASERLTPKDGTRILPIWNAGSSKERLDRTVLLPEAIRHLFAASAILISGFAARRDIGVRSAHFGCVKEDEFGQVTISLYIGKTDRDRVEVPVPAIIKKVVKVLEELSEDTRRAKGTEWLFEVAFDLDRPDRLVSSRFHQIIDPFLDFVGEAPPEGQERWNLSIHMLRRGYGIWYYYGLTGGSTDALSMIYRHNDPNMTRIYFTMALPGQINRLKADLDARLRSSAANRSKEDQDWIDRAYDRLSYLKTHQQAFDGPRCEIFVEKLLGLWRGTDCVIGAGGKALFNDMQVIAERAMASVRIGSRVNDPEALEAPLLQRFIEYAQTHFLEPVLGTNMWCAADPQDPEHRSDAECLKLKGRANAPWKKDGIPEDLTPDYDFACNRICIGCRHGAAFHDGQKALHEEVEQRRHAARHAATAFLADEGERLLAELEANIAAAGPIKKGGRL